MWGHARDVLPIRPDAAGIPTDEAADQAEKRRLARPVRPDDCKNLVADEIKRDIVDGRDATVVLLEIRHSQKHFRYSVSEYPAPRLPLQDH